MELKTFMLNNKKYIDNLVPATYQIAQVGINQYSTTKPAC